MSLYCFTGGSKVLICDHWSTSLSWLQFLWRAVRSVWTALLSGAWSVWSQAALRELPAVACSCFSGSTGSRLVARTGGAMPGAELSKGSWKGRWKGRESLKYNEGFTVTTQSDRSLHHGTSAGAEIGLEDSKHRLHCGREDTPGGLRTQRTLISPSSLPLTHSLSPPLCLLLLQ